MQNYKNDILTYNNNNSVDSNCADITFWNTGQADITINGGLLLVGGSSITFNANAGEMDKTIYNFSFDPAVAKNLYNLIVIRKVYI
jgi:hypothetical protein